MSNYREKAETLGRWPGEVDAIEMALKEAEARGRRTENDEHCAKLRAWVHDLQSGMYINCVYCGHRYGPKDKVPPVLADVLKQHIERCPQHPMSALKKQRDMLLEAIKGSLTKEDIENLNLIREALAFCEGEKK